jgi:hypothetical protein
MLFAVAVVAVMKMPKTKASTVVWTSEQTRRIVVAPHGMLTLQFAFSTDIKRPTKAKGNTMRFYNMEGSGIEINCYNFSCILGGSNIALTPVKLKDGTEEWLRATEEDILRAVVNS